MSCVGFSMELSSGALTRLEGPEVRAACTCAGGLYLANATGLFRVGGDSDDGAPIAVRLKLPATDCGDCAAKRLPAVVLEGVLDARLEVTAASESGSLLEGEAVVRNPTGLSGRTSVRLGRGHGRTWQVSLAMPDGGVFDIGAVVLVPRILDRRSL